MKAATIASAEIYLTHAPGMKERAQKLSKDFLRLSEESAKFSDDLAGLFVLIEEGAKVCTDVVESKVGHPTPDAQLSNAEIKDKNG